MNASLGMLLMVAGGLTALVDDHDVAYPPQPAPSYHDHGFWGRGLRPQPVVDPTINKHPIRLYRAFKKILPPGPGYGYGFRNGAPDGYGWYDPGTTIPLGFQADRTDEYYFRRDFAIPPEQCFFPTYYNAYAMRGQRYIPYTGAGGFHPAGGAPLGSSLTQVRPYDQQVNDRPLVPVPTFTGAQGAEPLPTEPAETDAFRQIP